MTSTRWASLRELALLYVGAAGLALGMTALGRAADCGPHGIDGQCGMASFICTGLGIVGALAIIVAGHIHMAVRWWRRRVQMSHPPAAS